MVAVPMKVREAVIRSHSAPPHGQPACVRVTVTDRVRVPRGGRRARARPTLLVLRALQIGDLLVACRPCGRCAGPSRAPAVLATTAALAPLVDRIGGVDAVLPTPDPTAVPWTGPAPDVAVNLHGTGPQSHRALDALQPLRRIGFRCPQARPGWEGPEWDAVAAAHPHERARWCALLQAAGIPADPDDLRLHRAGRAAQAGRRRSWCTRERHSGRSAGRWTGSPPSPQRSTIRTRRC